GPGGPQSSASRGRRRGPGWGALAGATVLAALIGGGVGVGTAVTLEHSSSAADDTSNSASDAPAQDAPKTNTPNWTQISSQASKSVAAIQVGQNGQITEQGSGFLYTDKNYVITNNHVVADAAKPGGEVQVVFNSGDTVGAKIVGRDPETDIAVLSLSKQPDGLKALPVGKSQSLKVGEPVMALGNPLGLADTVTTGIVSALNRPVATQNVGENQQADVATITNAIQTDAAINPGNSGGPLVNAAGQAIGVNSSAATLQDSSQSGQQSGSIGIGFAIPIAQATNIADQLIDSGKARHAYLGVNITTGEVQQDGVGRASALVSAVQGGSPAAKAGLKKGDNIIAANGTPVNSSVSLQALVRAQKAGDELTLTVVRGSDRQDVKVTLGAK
ncbi:PDZ domain-containing protein, partial [Brevibacterium sp. 5221]